MPRWCSTSNCSTSRSTGSGHPHVDDFPGTAIRRERLCGLMAASKTIRVQAPGGTDISFPIEGRQAFASSGIFRNRGQWGNRPTGAAYLAPVEGGSQGVVVVDGSMAG